jgi:hypothetical protein
MMTAASVVIVAVCCVAFAGCVVKGPEVRIGPPVEVKVEGDERTGGGKFCPPGQAKKGRC